MNWYILEIFVALLLGGLLARRLSDLIRAAVVRLMPVEKRISEQSFDLQAQRSTIIGAVVALLTAGALFYGMEVLRAQLTKAPVLEVTEQQLIRPLPSLPDHTSPEPPAKPQVQEDVPAPKTPPSSAPPEENSAKKEAPRPDHYAPPAAGAGPYYLQLGAYADPANAQRHVDALLGRFPGQVTPHFVPDTRGPHKVWLGAFTSRRSARAFRRHHGLRAFICKRTA